MHFDRTCIFSLLLFLLPFFSSCNAQHQIARQKSEERTLSCLSRFFTDRKHFEPCKKTVCFLFLQQPPFVMLDPAMKDHRDESLFPCAEPKKLYSNLGGVSFSVHGLINYKALCVWAGPKCTFDDLNEFVSDMAANTKTSSYMFGAQGLVAQLPNRVNNFTRTTVTVVEGEMVIVKSVVGIAHPVTAAFNQVFRGFDGATWIVLCSFLLGLFVLSFAVTLTFTRSVNPLGVVMALMGETHIVNNQCGVGLGVLSSGEESIVVHRTSLHRSAIALLGVAFSTFWIIVILFYEISVVNFIFNEKKERIWKPLFEFTDSELKRFCVLRQSTPEDVFAKAIDPKGTRFKSSADFSWTRSATYDACFNKLLDPKAPEKFLVAFRPEKKYEVRKRQACNQLKRIETEKPLMVKSAGWYIGSTVPESILISLNRGIIKAKMSGKISAIYNTLLHDTDPTCEEKKLSISPEMLAIPVSILIGPGLLLIFAVLIGNFYATRELEDKEEENEAKLDAVVGLSL